jgi:spermidine/putrescine transport system substrate-binding protein
MKSGSNKTLRLSSDPRLIPLRVLFASLMLILLAGCGSPAPTSVPTSTPIPLAEEIVFYNWEDDMPQSVLDAFTKEYGVKIKYLVYESQEEAIVNIQEGELYDVVVMESRFIPLLAEKNLLAKLNNTSLSNLKNISANFRELVYDPHNDYSVPYNWGTTGLVVRSDLVEQPVTRWADLWDPRYTGRTGLWMGQSREVIGLTLKSLGYSANSENPRELEEALQQLLELKPNVITLENFALDSSADVMASGEVVISMGYAGDALAGNELNSSIQYVLPGEGALLWNDTFVIPANSPNQYTAELFLNFLMRPDINATIANENLYATPNEAALQFIDPEILNNPVIFPVNSDLVNAELILPLTPEGQLLYDQIWERFTTSP